MSWWEDQVGNNYREMSKNIKESKMSWKKRNKRRKESRERYLLIAFVSEASEPAKPLLKLVMPLKKRYLLRDLVDSLLPLRNRSKITYHPKEVITLSELGLTIKPTISGSKATKIQLSGSQGNSKRGGIAQSLQRTFRGWLSGIKAKLRMLSGWR